MNTTYNFHSDAGHGWLEVPIKEVVALKIKVSNYSYKKDGNAYLEEDCDAPKFIDAYKIKYNENPKIKSLDCVDNSVIRNYRRYNEAI